MLGMTKNVSGKFRIVAKSTSFTAITPEGNTKWTSYPEFRPTNFQMRAGTEKYSAQKRFAKRR